MLAVALGLTPSTVHAADYFAAGLTRESAWEDILKTTRIHVEFPFVGFGNVFVALPGICVDDSKTLHPIDASLRSRGRENPLAVASLVSVHRLPESKKDVEGKMIPLFTKQWDMDGCRQ